MPVKKKNSTAKIMQSGVGAQSLPASDQVKSFHTDKEEETGSKVPTQKELEKIINLTRVPGIAILSTKLHTLTAGVTNVETQKGVDNKTIFEAASLSKPVFNLQDENFGI